MKKLLALLLIYTQVSYAGLPPTTIKGQSDAAPVTKFNFETPFNQVTNLGGTTSLIETGNTNILINPGFEDGNVTGWAASGGSGGVSSTFSATGALGLSWDSDSAAQTTTSDLITIPNGFKGNNGYAYCNIKTVSGTATHTFTVDDGTTNIVTPVTINGSTARFQRTAVNFVYPSSGSIRIKVTSVAANEPNIYIDDCYIGEATNVSSVAQAQLVGTVKVTGCASPWSTTSTAFASFATQTGCSYAVTGQALAPTTNIPAIRFANLAPGEYKLEYEGAIRAGVSGTDAYFQFFDGTNTAREEPSIFTNTTNIVVPGINQSISYTSPQTNVTLQIRSKVSSGGQSFIYGTTGNPGVIKVYYFPTQSQLAVSSAQTDYDWTSYTPTFTGLGTPTSVEFAHRRVGDTLEIRGKYTSGTSTATEARISLPAGLTSADTTKIPSLRMCGRGGRSATSSTFFGGQSVLIEPSVTYMTFGGESSTTSPLTKQNGDTLMGTGNTAHIDARIPIQGWSGNQRAPTLVGSVTSNASGAERIERATFSNNGSACSITSQSGSWITSVTRNGTGRCDVVYPSGTFSSAPTCTATSLDTGSRYVSTNTPTTTGVSLFHIITSALGDGSMSLICMGAR